MIDDIQTIPRRRQRISPRRPAATEEIESLAAANQGQAVMVSEVEESVPRLNGERFATDGGRDTVIKSDTDAVSILDDLRDDMPDVVVEMLSDEQLREVAIGNLDPTDLL